MESAFTENSFSCKWNMLCLFGRYQKWRKSIALLFVMQLVYIKCGINVKVNHKRVVYNANQTHIYNFVVHKVRVHRWQLVRLCSQVSSVELMEGDIIVMGSDGLFDNVFDHEIVSTMATYSEVAKAGTHFLAFFLCIVS